MHYFFNNTIILFTALLLASCGNKTKDRTIEGNNIRYKNPILTFDFSDPDVIRVGKDYYMTASSFNMVPGLPILHSKDLVNWTIIGHAISKIPDALHTYKNRTINDLDYNTPRLGKGVWAPSIRHNDGYFWIYWGDPDAGIYMVKSKDPSGIWSEPILVQSASGWIDPCPLWDNSTDKAYLSFAHAKSRNGINERIDVCEMNWEGTKLIGTPITVFDAKDNVKYPTDRYQKTIEGTKFMQRNNWYYILCPAGGVEPGWQAIMRSKNPMGPYRTRTVCETGKTGINGPHQGGLVDSHSGTWWFIHFQSAGTLGRIVRLEPAHWKNNWPVIGFDEDTDGIGNPVHSYSFPHNPTENFIQTSDDFNTNTLGMQWQWPANPKTNWYNIKNGKLILPARFLNNITLEEIPQVLTQMFPDLSFTATTKINIHGNNIRGGLTTLGRKSFDIGLEKTDNNTTISMRYGTTILASSKVYKSTIWLRLETKGELPLPLKRRKENSKNGDNNSISILKAYQKEDLDRWSNGIIQGQFHYSTNGIDFIKLGPEFEVRSGMWIGARLGLYSVQTSTEAIGETLIDYIHIEK